MAGYGYVLFAKAGEGGAVPVCVPRGWEACAGDELCLPGGRRLFAVCGALLLNEAEILALCEAFGDVPKAEGKFVYRAFEWPEEGGAFDRAVLRGKAGAGMEAASAFDGACARGKEGA